MQKTKSAQKKAFAKEARNKKPSKPPLDFLLLASILFLFGLGLVTLYSGSYGHAGGEFIIKQMVYGLIGLIVFCIAVVVKLDRFRSKAFFLMALFATLILNIIPIIIGPEINGAKRWVDLGIIGFQPSEIAKIILPFYLAHMFDKKQEHIGNFMGSVLPLLIVSGTFILVIVLQNSFGMAAFISINLGLIFIMAGVKKRYIAGIVIFGLLTAIVAILLKPHRIARILSFMNPDAGGLQGNFQANQSIAAVASGGFWGKGLGLGMNNTNIISEIQSDFIFTSYAEEFGFMGVLSFVCLTALFMVQGYTASFKAEDLFRRLLAFSYVTIIATQTYINLAVIVRALPTTGIPLPFFSAGGSSLISSLGICGVIVNISRVEKPLEVTYHRSTW